MNDCGICDNCLRTSNEKLTRGGFEELRKSVLELLAAGPLQAYDLLTKLQAVENEQLQQVLDFLQNEQKIRCSATGIVQLS